MRVAALIPAKGFTNAKMRLQPILSAMEREVLARSMLRDVLRQVIPARGLEGTYVVTADSRVSRLAASMGAGVIAEREERGETEAVHLALGELKRRGMQVVLVLPGDIPLIRTGDVEMILEQVPDATPATPFALLVPSHNRMGTNGLLLFPPDILQLRFGYDSFSYHLSAAAAKNLVPRVLENERIGLDVDEPKDLERLLSAGIPGDTCSALLLTTL